MVFGIGCNDKAKVNSNCSEYENIEYSIAMADTTMHREAYEYHEILLNRFKETALKGVEYDAYHLQFYSSHGYGRSVKFENDQEIYTISVKCLGNKEWNEDCKEYKINIEKREWIELEKMIYEFDFWTDEHFRTNEDVLDGFAYLLEGNRPSAKACKELTNKLIARGSPWYDKIGSLCENILKHEDQLRFRYEQFNKIK